MAAPTITLRTQVESFNATEDATFTYAGGGMVGLFDSWSTTGPTGCWINPATQNVALALVGKLDLPGGPGDNWGSFFWVTAADLAAAGVTAGTTTFRSQHPTADGHLAYSYEVGNAVGAPVYYVTDSGGANVSSISQTIPRPADSLVMQICYAYGHGGAGSTATPANSQTTSLDVNYDGTRQVYAQRQFTTASATENLGFTLGTAGPAMLLTIVFAAVRTVTTLSPADGATGVSVNPTLQVTFSVDISVNTGNVRIVETGVGTVETIPITDTSRVSVSGAVLSIDPSNPLNGGTAYHVEIDSTCVPGFAGIANTTTWNFVTESAMSAVGPVAATGVDSPAITQTNTLTATGASAVTDVGAPSIGQDHALVATGASATTATDAPAVTQTHTLAAAGVSAVTDVGAPSLVQDHDLVAVGPSAVTDVGGPAITQTHTLIAVGVAATTGVDSPSLEETLTPQPAVATTTVDSPAITQTHTLAAVGASAVATVGTPALGQTHDVDAMGPTAGTSVGGPALTQTHVLSPVGAFALADVGSPAIDQDFSAIGAVGETFVDAPVLNQVHMLLVVDVWAEATVDSPTLVPIPPPDHHRAPAARTIVATPGNRRIISSGAAPDRRIV